MLRSRLATAVSCVRRTHHVPTTAIRHSTWRSSLRALPVYATQFSTTSRLPLEQNEGRERVFDDFRKTFEFPAATWEIRDLDSRDIETEVVLHGYLGSKRQAGKNLVFAELRSSDDSHSVQLMALLKRNPEDERLMSMESQQNIAKLLSLNSETPIAIKGIVRDRKAKPQYPRTGHIDEVEIDLIDILPLNHFPKDINPEIVFPPEQRHLQIRFDKKLRDALKFRSRAAQSIRAELCGDRDFIEVETPLLFKSTPEGAREFLVPTRDKGFAYALPQSPQQYKQILMASGIPRYVQFAKCFRDEDQRADRQPEFTQVDLEMAFATGEDVMTAVEATVKRLWHDLLGIQNLKAYPRMTYHDAMSTYGSDKPDVRLESKISRIDYMLPVDLISKIGPLKDPIVEVMKIPISNQPSRTRKFVTQFMDSPEAIPFNNNPDGQPGIFVYDSRRPLSGLQAFGFEAAEYLEETLNLEHGDLLVLQARKNEPFFSGGSTPMGNLRLALHDRAVAWEYLPAPTGFEFLWITDFPLFSPSSSSEPGQGGSAGLSSTHHPFTAPKTAQDVDLLLGGGDPRAVIAEHYDLVCNGVELGGGSRRVHNHAVQEFILRDILKMSEERLQDFAHLIEVLRAGCPPHAGMALGFDRLIAVMLGRESIRDVVAFPKNGSGEDVLVKSPSKMTEDQLQTYHLRLRGEESEKSEKSDWKRWFGLA